LNNGYEENNPQERLRISPSYLIGTWTGRLILINTIVFLALCVVSGSVFMPDTQSLLLFGAKEPVLIAQGEVWRLFTPIFIHIGIIHFAFNNFMLHVIGQQLERVVGGAWFLAIYLSAGVVGNIASNLFTVNLSAGASGAIFGLLGLGFFLEYSIGNKIAHATGEKPKNRVYAMTVAINLAFGFMMPFVDNSAHVGGLIAGVALAFAMVNLRPNKIFVPKRNLGIFVAMLLLVASLIGVFYAGSPQYLEKRLMQEAAESDDISVAFQLLSQTVLLNPHAKEARFQRAKLLLFNREEQAAIADLREIVEDESYRVRLEELVEKLTETGLVKQAWQLQRILAHSN